MDEANCICTYREFYVITFLNRYWIFNPDGAEIVEAELVTSLPPEIYDLLTDEDLLGSCSDYDFSGELDDGSAYCFWKVKEAK